MSGIFVLFNSKFECQVNTTLGDATYSQINERCDRPEDDHCRYTNSTGHLNACPVENYHYTPSDVDPSSLVEKFNLVCDDDDKGYLANFIMFIGYNFGSIGVGYLSDNWGRRKTIIFSSAMHVVMNVLAIFVNSIYLYYVVKFFLGYFVVGAYVSAFIYCDEFLLDKYRTDSNAMYAGFFALGYGVMTWGAWQFRTWQAVHLTVAAIALVGTLLAVFTFEESPNYLISKGNNEKAQEIIRKIATMNKKVGGGNIVLDGLSEDSGSVRKVDPTSSSFEIEDGTGSKNGGQLQDQDPEKKDLIKASENKTNILTNSDGSMQEKKVYTTLDLFRNGPKMTFLTLNLVLSWFACSLAYYGLSTGSAALPVNLYVGNWIYAACDIPSCFFATYFMGKIGRRWTSILSYIIGGSTILASTFLIEWTYCVKDEQSIYDNHIILASFILINLGRLIITTVFICMYKYTLELFPVCIRGNAMGLANVACRTGALMSPVFLYMGKKYTWLPGVVYGSINLLAGILSWWYPETRGEPMMLTINQATAWYEKTMG